MQYNIVNVKSLNSKPNKLKAAKKKKKKKNNLKSNLKILQINQL